MDMNLNSLTEERSKSIFSATFTATISEQTSLLLRQTLVRTEATAHQELGTSLVGRASEFTTHIFNSKYKKILAVLK
ncbi:unnamed protein product [Amoebophrya sp. A25]|nr:unnamed protein product [Amoebophrya sp. A25]|eukprot:GSA25T00009061001.1